jgi:hypothetical protein
MVSISADGEQLSVCPSCTQNSLRIENGCHSCLNDDCGFSKCDA